MTKRGRPPFYYAIVFVLVATSEVAADAFVRGDGNGDMHVDVSDAVLTLLTFFGTDAPSPACLKPFDSNDDGSVNVADAVYTLSFLFRRGPILPAPYPECGEDPTPDEIADCDEPAASCGRQRRYQRVIYWGQNGYGSTDPNRGNWEPSLREICDSGDYDTVVIGFVVTYFDPRNPRRLPGVNFSYHCGRPFSGYVSLLDCPRIGADIRHCREAGMTVMISLGGAVGVYLFDDDDQARGFARTIWDMFLGGSSEEIPRPFGDVVLDGVNLDIEAEAHNHHSAFTERLHELMEEAQPDRYLMTAAPQCPFPDAHLGPAPGSALGDHPQLFDQVYVQFYNNFCRYSADDVANFRTTLTTWHEWTLTTNGPEILVGLPATPFAAPAGGYVPRAELEGLASILREFERVGGFMIWDASFDRQSVEDGRTYSEALDALLNESP
jgi:chitinase